tara:strand:- start:3080 stop:4096 length:1017 start_codon:yes stop_codon:yes gene_type:complete
MRVATLAGTGEAGWNGDGPGTQCEINQPFGVVKGPDGAVWFTDLGNHRVRRIEPNSGIVETRVGNGLLGSDGNGGPALEASLNEPYELRFDAARHLYFVDMQAHVVRRVDANDESITTLAGTGEAGFGGDGGDAREAQLSRPHSIELDGRGGLYIADIANHRLRRVVLQTGIINTWAGTGGTKPVHEGDNIFTADLFGPRAIAFDRGGNLVLALREGNKVIKVDCATGRVQHIAGTGEKGYEGDHRDAREAKLAGPKGLALDKDDHIYIADTESHTVRRIDAQTNIITTIVGDGTSHDGPDGAPLDCGLARPHGVYVDSGGNVYIGDTENHRVRALLV